MVEPSSSQNNRADGRVLDTFFDVLERHWQELPAEEPQGIGLEVRLRAEALLRLPGPWSFYRLREGLRGCTARTKEHEGLFKQAFSEVFGQLDQEELEKEYIGKPFPG